MTTLQNPQRTLELAAQGLANLGKKDPQLTTASFGALQLRDREGNVISTLDYRTPLNRAWNQALQALSEQGIDITPSWAQKPFLAQIKTSSDDTQNLGVYITPEKLVVKAWLKTGTEAAEGEIIVGDTILYPLETPIEIPFDSPLNFDFPRVNDTDILSVLDIDGEEMFRIQSGPVDEAYCTQYNLPSDLATKGALWTDLFPNPEWVKSHNTLPGLLILDNLRGIGRRFDVKYLLSLEQRLQALEDKLK